MEAEGSLTREIYIRLTVGTRQSIADLRLARGQCFLSKMCLYRPHAVFRDWALKSNQRRFTGLCGMPYAEYHECGHTGVMSSLINLRSTTPRTSAHGYQLSELSGKYATPYTYKSRSGFLTAFSLQDMYGDTKFSY
jgi:hypothetical protein